MKFMAPFCARSTELICQDTLNLHTVMLIWSVIAIVAQVSNMPPGPLVQTSNDISGVTVREVSD